MAHISRTGCTERHQLRTQVPSNGSERVQVHRQLDRVHRNVVDQQAAHACRTVLPVAGVSTERLRDTHDDVARFSQRRIDRHVPNHARHQPVVGIPGAEHALQQLDAERLDFIDVLRPGKPAVRRPDVSFRRPLPDLGGEQLAHHRAHRRLGSQKVQALFASPPRIALHCGNHFPLHRGRVAGPVEKVARPLQDAGVVNFHHVEDIGHCVHSPSCR
jgi:hypothetical protein